MCQPIPVLWLGKRSFFCLSCIVRNLPFYPGADLPKNMWRICLEDLHPGCLADPRQLNTNLSGAAERLAGCDRRGAVSLQELTKNRKLCVLSWQIFKF